jgi:hypothetical protein
MSNDKTFQPHFGPNGAVMNATTMTPELRLEYEREASTKQSVLRVLPFPLLLLALWGIQVIFQPAIDPVWIALVAGIAGPGLFSRTRKRV